MPWQQMVADVALEIRDDGLPAYRKVVLTVPRQSGKTTLLLSTFVHRALAWGSPQVMVYAAQTGVDSRKKFVDEQIPMLSRSPFKPLFKPRLTSGHESILWKNGSRHGIAASTEKSSHGPTLHLGVIDEAWAQPDARLEQAFSPAMVTKRDAQLWMVSTAGTEDSEYFRGKVESGRLQGLDTETGTAFFEYSAPDDADPEDPDVWASCMPALGYTIDESVIRAELHSLDRDEFRRAYLNQWVAAGATIVIPSAEWHACADPDSRSLDPVSFAIEVNEDRSWSCISQAGKRADGLWHAATVDYRPGTAWVLDRIFELRSKWRPASVTIDPASPAGSLIAPLEAAGVKVTKPSQREIGQACGALYDGAMQGTFRHRDEASLNIALRSARKRLTGDVWVWERRGTADITPLISVTLALRGAQSSLNKSRMAPLVINLDDYAGDDS